MTFFPSALGLELRGELAAGGRLSAAVDAYHDDDGGFALHVERAAHAGDGFEARYQQLGEGVFQLALVAYPLVYHHAAELRYKLLRRLYAYVAEYELLLKLVPEPLVHGVVREEVGDALRPFVPGVFQLFGKTFEKAQFMCLLL